MSILKAIAASPLLAHQVIRAVVEGRSPQWPKVRADYLKLHPTCTACGGKDSLNVHHMKPFHLYPELELDPTNLTTLCEKWHCHFRVGHCYDWKLFNQYVLEDANNELTRVRQVNGRRLN